MREEATVTIQNKWKGNRWRRLVPKIMMNHKNQAAIKIQKWIKGHL